MRRQENCASTCANHSSGSAGQKGGSLRLTTETAAEGGGVCATGAGGSVALPASPSPSDIARNCCRQCQSHQCSVMVGY